jgi:CBS domain containing-hemolysin-like protein
MREKFISKVKKSKAISSISALYATFVSEVVLADAFSKAEDSLESVTDGLITIVTPLMVLCIMGVGILFIAGKIPKAWAIGIASGGVIVGSAGPIAALFL